MTSALMWACGQLHRVFLGRVLCNCVCKALHRSHKCAINVGLRVFYTRIHISQALYSIACLSNPKTGTALMSILQMGKQRYNTCLKSGSSSRAGAQPKPHLITMTPYQVKQKGPELWIQSPWAESQLSLCQWDARGSALLSSEALSLWSFTTEAEGSCYTLEQVVGSQGQVPTSLLLLAPLCLAQRSVGTGPLHRTNVMVMTQRLIPGLRTKRWSQKSGMFPKAPIHD